MSHSLVKPARPILQRGHPLARGLALAMPFWELGGSTAYDESLRRGTGTLNNAPARVWTPYGPGLSFVNASSQNVSLGRSVLSSAANCTLSVVVKTTGARGCWLYVGPPTSASGLGIGSGAGTWDSDGRDFIGLYGGIAWVTNGITMSDGWHHATMTVANNVPRFFLDGVLQPGTSASSPAAPDTNTFIGGSTLGATRYYTGEIAHAAVWSRPLAAAEVYALHRDPWAMYRPLPRFPGVQAVTAAATGHYYRRLLAQMRH